MSVYLDATDATKNIDLLLDPEVFPMTKEYKEAWDAKNSKFWGITYGACGVFSAVFCVLAGNNFRKTKEIADIVYCVFFGTCLFIMGNEAKKHITQYYQIRKIPSSNLDEVYQKIGLKVEEIATSGLPKEKQDLLRKIEIIRYSILDIQLEEAGLKQVWIDFDARLSKIQAQLHQEGIQLSRQDELQIVIDYLKDHENAECILQLIALVGQKVETHLLKQEVVRTFTNYYQFDKTKDLFLACHIMPYLKDKDIKRNSQSVALQVTQFLNDGIDVGLMLKIIFAVSKGSRNLHSLVEVTKILVEHREEKQIGVEPSHSALVHN